jgi:antitoxin component YwqK of YwqJK toxin-antitoxin module
LIFFVPATICSCGDTKVPPATPVEPRIAKTVPAVFINALDSSFTKHQDTVCYQGKYFTGYRFALYENGDTACLQSYFNGVEEGFQRKWYPGKLPSEERFYINGKKEGTHKGWWPDGKPKFIFSLYNDVYEGEFKEWYSSGLLSKDFNYVKGQEEGSEKMWWDNGTVRANYVIRDGRKYGLIGLAICKNPNDSILEK